MEQDLNSKPKQRTGIIGAGPAGSLAAIFLAQMSPDHEITLFDGTEPLSTLLPTGGGRCNLTYYESDNKELAKFYPRGEKFLLSVFSKFNSLNTIEFFESIGIPTFVQDDSRVFPTSESSKEVAKVLKCLIQKYSIKVIREKVEDLSRENDLFLVKTNAKKHSYFHNIVIATGGKGNGFELAKKLGHKIEEPKAALSPLKIKETEFYELSGLTLKNISITAFFKNKKISKVYDDMLFTHKSITGPAIYKTSSLCAYSNFNEATPLRLSINITNLTEEEIDYFVKEAINTNPHKTVKNVFSKLAPKRLLELILKINKIDENKEITHLSKKEKSIIIKNLTELELNAITKTTGEEIVTAGGISLNEINSKDMSSKIIPNLYFCGEVINVDGFTGGFNLQNCWSTAFVCADGINSKQ